MQRSIGKWDISVEKVDEKRLRRTRRVKGEALAALIELSSSVVVTTKCRGNSETFMKKINAEDESVCNTIDRGLHGTTLLVENLFYNLPVRRKSTKPASEISKIRECIHRLSVLHHNVRWLLYDTNNHKELLKFNREDSVLCRIESLYGPWISTALRVSYHYYSSKLTNKFPPRVYLILLQK